MLCHSEMKSTKQAGGIQNARPQDRLSGFLSLRRPAFCFLYCSLPLEVYVLPKALLSVGKVRGCVSTPRVRLQFATRRSPAFSTRPQADNNQPMFKFAALVIVINVLVLTCKSWNVLDPQGLTRSSRHKKSHDLLSLLSSGL